MSQPFLHLTPYTGAAMAPHVIVTISNATEAEPLRLSPANLRLVAEQCNAMADKLERAGVKVVKMPRPPGTIGQS